MQTSSQPHEHVPCSVLPRNPPALTYSLTHHRAGRAYGSKRPPFSMDGKQKLFVSDYDHSGRLRYIAGPTIETTGALSLRLARIFLGLRARCSKSSLDNKLLDNFLRQPLTEPISQRFSAPFVNCGEPMVDQRHQTNANVSSSSELKYKKRNNTRPTLPFISQRRIEAKGCFEI